MMDHCIGLVLHISGVINLWSYIYSYPVNMWAFCMFIYACRLLSGTVALSTTIYGMGGMWDMCVAVSALGNTSRQLASTL